MKKFTLLSFALLAATALLAQSMPKQYVTLEHFTNSNCSICGSKNPSFYNLINQYPDDVHHLAIHPPVPYSSCKLYQANTTENSALANQYSINGTPRVALNGTLVPASSQLLPATTLEAALGQTSPVGIKVVEGGAYPDKTVSVTVSVYGTVPAGNYKLFAAVAESTVNYTGNNNEPKHYDVFRAMLPNIDGESITLPPAGGSATYNYTYTFAQPSGWTSNFDSLYVLAYVKNADTKEILNSGTRFDPVFTGTADPQRVQAVNLFPNPATDQVSATINNDEIKRVEVFSINGQLVQTAYNNQQNQVRIPLASLNPGIYLVKITGAKSLYTGKIVKDR
ncbi:MAG: T9SS type A sorting domain-containing protein [Bacteroidetes bacterium]|nr:MAG: T9SS type A sorting domain-containing protein [Bacteroidota bacterium]